MSESTKTNVCNQIPKIPNFSHKATSNIDTLQMAAEENLNSFIKLEKKMIKALNVHWIEAF